MNINYLCEFVTLAETNNFQEAADKLFISQSSLSKHLKAMEKKLGVPLFDRTTRSVKLSKYGQLLLPYAYKIVQLQREYTSVINHAVKKNKDSITIASTAQMFQYSITEILAQYKQQYFSAVVDVVIQPHKNLKNLLHQHKADFIFIGEPPHEACEGDFERILFLSEPMVALLPKSHPLSASDTICIDDLRNVQLIIQDESSIENEVFINLCESYSFEPNILTIPIGNALVDLVKKSIGIAIMWEIPAQNVFHPDVSLKVVEPRTVIDVNLLYLKSTKLSPAAKDFLQCVKSFQHK